jgi:hypothetical protein
MDRDIIKSAAKTVFVTIVLGVLLFWLVSGLEVYDSVVVPHGLLFLVLYLSLMGFLGVYFCRKRSKELSISKYFALIMLTCAFFLLFFCVVFCALFFLSLSQSRYLPSFTVFLFVLFEVSVLLFFGYSVGAVAAFIILLNKEERKHLEVSKNFVVTTVWAAIMAILMYLFFAWAYDSFNPPGCGGSGLWPFNPPTSCVSKGWVVLQPLAPSKSFKSADQRFTTSFNNAVGTSIRITALNVTEILGPAACADTDGGVGAETTFINGKAFDSTEPVIVAAGSAFNVSVLCVYPAGDYPVSARARSDPYEVAMTVGYYSIIGGIITPHTEMGIVRGGVE